MAETDKKSNSKKNEILIAIIGLIGILVTALISNWGKLFPDSNILEIHYSQEYKPTGNFETELRYFFLASSSSASLYQLMRDPLDETKLQILNEYLEQEKHLLSDTLLISIEEANITVDNAVKKFLPIYEKYYTIEELQELNKLYSTDIMNDMVDKFLLVFQDSGSLQVELIQDYIKRLKKKLEEIE